MITEMYAIINNRIIPISAAGGLYHTREEAEAALKPKEFIIGKHYQWAGNKAWHNQGKRNGPLKCVYIGDHQAALTGKTDGIFENNNGLYIIAGIHLRSGDLIQID